MRAVLLSVLLSIFGSVSVCVAQSVVGSSGFLTAKPEDIRSFRDARLGLFIHWGRISIKGLEIGSRVGRQPGYGGPPVGGIPAAEYDELYKQFNPTLFNASQWMKLAREAGCKYVVIVTKHLDGFCMFDTKLTDCKITNSPFKRDVVAEIAAACHKEALRLGFYYEPTDWHHPDFLTKNHSRYKEYFHGQIRELLTNYSKVSECGLTRSLRRPRPGTHKAYSRWLANSSLGS